MPRVGVVGVGGLGFHHARILRDMPVVRFGGFFDSRAERAATVAAELGITAHDSLDALLAEVDASTADTVASVAREYFDPDRQTVLRLGPL